MAVRNSEYERRDLDLYQTPAWVTRCLLHHIPPRVSSAWEPAAASGQISRELRGIGLDVFETDINPQWFGNSADFLSLRGCEADAIITNPPFSHAVAFIRHALELTRPRAGFVAMLLRSSFAHAYSYDDAFSGHPAFTGKIELTRRIKWFDLGNGKSPSESHACFMWDWLGDGPQLLKHEPRQGAGMWCCAACAFEAEKETRGHYTSARGWCAVGQHHVATEIYWMHEFAAKRERGAQALDRIRIRKRGEAAR